MKLESNTRKNTKNGIKPAIPTPQTRTVTTTRPLTTIEAKIDVGFGNQLFLRGEGPGLSWEKGTPLKCVDPSTWQWTAEASDQLKFKLLLPEVIRN